MDKGMLEIISARVPKINPDIARGIATIQVPQSEEYIDRDLRASSEQFPEGLEYVGYEICTTDEEVRELMKPRGEKIYVELSRTDMYLVKYKFKYNGVEIEPRPVYLPYVLEAGIMHIRGTPYSVSPVIADVALSVTEDGLFAPLSMAKVQFMRLPNHINVNGDALNTSVAHSNLYRRSSKSKAVKLGKKARSSTLIHYMLCKYGFTQLFEQFFNAHGLVVGYPDKVHQMAYPPEQFAIVNTATAPGFPPPGNRDKNYRPSDIRVAVPIHQMGRADVADALGGFFYVVDQFPERVKPEHVENPRLWQRLMGHVIFGDEYGEGELMGLMQDHLESLDGYVNYQSRRTLHQGNVMVDDIYQLFGYVITNMPEMILNSSTTVASMYGKRLMVVRYLLSSISYAIYKLMFRLRVQAKKKKGRLTEREVVDTMRKGLHRDLITTVTSHHSEVTPVSSPGDNMFFKITSNLVLQESTDSSRGRSGGGSLEDRSKWMHASIIEVASYAAMGKSEPTGRTKINPCLRLSPRGDVERHPEHIRLLD